jgi:polyisoprenoid-binding protein YceI
MSDLPLTADEPPPSRGPWRWLRWVLLAAVAAVALLYGAIFVYTEFIKDSPDRLDTADRDAALAITTPATSATPSAADDPATTASGTAADTSTPATPAATTTAAAPAPAGASTWTVTDASTVGYRVTEVLFGVDAEGVGRTNQVTGSLVFEGTTVTAAEFTVDVGSITSDESRRDSQFRGRIMTVDEFPTATFVLTEPIEVGSEPVDGANAIVTATGDLTLRGVTREVTFEIDASVQNGRIGVLGSIPVVFADYGIANPSNAGVTTEDNGLLEFVLVFEPA